MMRTMCNVKLVGKKGTEELMDMLGLKEAPDKLAKANGMRWSGHVLRQPEENALKAMVHRVDGKRKQGRLRIKWRVQVGRKHEKNRFKERNAAGGELQK